MGQCSFADKKLLLTQEDFKHVGCTTFSDLFSNNWGSYKISANKDYSISTFERYLSEPKTLEIIVPACPDYCQDEIWNKKSSIGDGPSTVALKLIRMGLPIWSLLTKRSFPTKVTIYYATQESKDPDHIKNRGINPEDYLEKINNSINETQIYLSQIFNKEPWGNISFSSKSMDSIIQEKDEKDSDLIVKQIKQSRIYNLATERQKTYRRVFLHHPEMKTNFVKFFRHRALVDITEHLTFSEALKRKRIEDNSNIVIFTLSPLSLLSYYNYNGNTEYLPVIYPEIIQGTDKL